ncbi:hypothetical protein SRB5_45350 [Streptomyces sp. RB5]|uniref:Antitoxin n=1 Tax=Streptomyces smaragdinus TaxID=2585196 RepID=A0A7K0CLJ9_9ACTN|nr:type II toxin-antitoxin system prevent-host-death family antitoxin [Streptomyces smaragdinus]MQY14369.1 hypothetical protein [Streptomyces smaragdinus]
MSASYPIADARGRLGELVRRAAQREHITLTDQGAPVAVLVSPAELAGLRDALAVACLERDRALNPAAAVPFETGRAGGKEPSVAM